MFSGGQGGTEGEALHPVLAMVRMSLCCKGLQGKPDSQSGQLRCSELVLELSALWQDVPMLGRTVCRSEQQRTALRRIRSIVESRAGRHRGRSPAPRSCYWSGLPPLL